MFKLLARRVRSWRQDPLRRCAQAWPGHLPGRPGGSPPRARRRAPARMRGAGGRARPRTCQDGPVRPPPLGTPLAAASGRPRPRVSLRASFSVPMIFQISWLLLSPTAQHDRVAAAIAAEGTVSSCCRPPPPTVPCPGRPSTCRVINERGRLAEVPGLRIAALIYTLLALRLAALDERPGLALECGAQVGGKLRRDRVVVCMSFDAHHIWGARALIPQCSCGSLNVPGGREPPAAGPAAAADKSLAPNWPARRPWPPLYSCRPLRRWAQCGWRCARAPCTCNTGGRSYCRRGRQTIYG